MPTPVNYRPAPCCKNCLYYTHFEEKYCELFKFGITNNQFICSEHLAQSTTEEVKNDSIP